MIICVNKITIRPQEYPPSAMLFIESRFAIHSIRFQAIHQKSLIISWRAFLEEIVSNYKL